MRRLADGVANRGQKNNRPQVTATTTTLRRLRRPVATSATRRQ